MTSIASSSLCTILDKYLASIEESQIGKMQFKRIKFILGLTTSKRQYEIRDFLTQPQSSCDLIDNLKAKAIHVIKDPAAEEVIYITLNFIANTDYAWVYYRGHGKNLIYDENCITNEYSLAYRFKVIALGFQEGDLFRKKDEISLSIEKPEPVQSDLNQVQHTAQELAPCDLI